MCWVRDRWHRKGGILNPASMKQALVEGAERIPGINLYEQGAGKMNLLNSTVGPACLAHLSRLSRSCNCEGVPPDAQAQAFPLDFQSYMWQRTCWHCSKVSVHSFPYLSCQAGFICPYII